MGVLTVGGVDYNVLDYGTGIPILFVHGFPLDHTMWNAQLDPLSKTHRVIAPDLRGFGATALADAPATMEQYADDLAALLDIAAPNERVVFCGLSMGGYIAWQFARKYPDRLRGLILCDTKAAADTDEARKTREKMAKHVMQSGSDIIADTLISKLFGRHAREHMPHVVDAIRTVIVNTDPEAIAAALHGLAARPDMTDFLPKISVPSLLVVGEEDEITPPEEMREVAKRIPDAELKVISRAGHMAPVENPDAVNDAFESFLVRLRR